MKKYFKSICVFLTVFICCSTFAVTASASARQTARYELPFEVNAQSYILVSLDTGEVIFEKNSEEQRIPASLTKLMTSYVVFKYVEDLDNTTVTAKAYLYDELYGLNASTADIKKGETLSMRQLLYAMLLPSANEAANIVADSIGNGSISNFCMLMNTEAKKLGCTNTNFSNPHGLFIDNHYTSAYDLYLIAKACYETPGFMEIATTVSYEMPVNTKHADPYSIYSTVRMQNKASPYYEKYIRGMKTGTLDEAGHNFVTVCEKDAQKYILVVMGAQKTETSALAAFDTTSQIMNYFYEDYSLKPANSLERPVSEIKLKYAKESDTLLLYPKSEVYSVLPNDVNETSFQKVYDIPDFVTAPVQEGDVVGTVSYYIAGGLVGTSELVCDKTYERDMLIFVVEKTKEAFTSLYFKVVVVMVVLLIIAFFIYRYYIGRKYAKMQKVHRRTK